MQNIESAPTAKRNVLAVFGGMVLHPRATFVYLREQGRLSWLWPLLLAAVMIVVWVGVDTTMSQSAVQQAQSEQLQNLSAEQRAQTESVIGLFTNPIFLISISAIFSIVGYGLVMLIQGGLFYLGNLVWGGQSKFHPMWRMTVWASALPLIVQNLVMSAGALLMGHSVKAGLAALAPSPAGVTIPPLGLAVTQTFLGGIHVYWLWTTVLLVIGVAATAQVSWRKSLVIVLVVWLLGLAVTLGFTAVGVGLAQGFGAGG